MYQVRRVSNSSWWFVCAYETFTIARIMARSLQRSGINCIIIDTRTRKVWEFTSKNGK